MAFYYVNKQKQTNGDHEVHTSTCGYIPNLINRLYLGEFSNCADAVIEAKKTYSKSNGCYYCSKVCNLG